MRATASKPRLHPEGYAVDVRVDGIKYLTAYGASADEAITRAIKASAGYEEIEARQ